MENLAAGAVAGVLFLYTGILLVLGWASRRAMNRRTAGSRPKVSVVIAARNEARNISSCLEALARQTYPAQLWEVIVVDDRSTDETAEGAGRWSARLPALKVLRVAKVPKGKQAKKHALEQAISCASGEVILTTDADCRPGPKWIELMAAQFDPRVDAVIGFSAQRFPQGRLWARAVATQGLAAGVASAAAVGLGAVATCTGRNLGYRKRLFVEQGGFGNLHCSVSGDDDLLMQRFERDGASVVFAGPSEAVVSSCGPQRLGAALGQRLRHLSAGRYYSFGILFFYGVYHLLGLLLWVGAVAATVGAVPWLVGIGGLCGKGVGDALLLWYFARRLKQPFDLVGLALWEVYELLSILILAPLSTLVRIRWKEEVNRRPSHRTESFAAR